jgi:hypothetical protein
VALSARTNLDQQRYNTRDWRDIALGLQVQYSISDALTLRVAWRIGLVDDQGLWVEGLDGWDGGC